MNYPYIKGLCRRLRISEFDWVCVSHCILSDILEKLFGKRLCSVRVKYSLVNTLIISDWWLYVDVGEFLVSELHKSLSFCLNFISWCCEYIWSCFHYWYNNWYHSFVVVAFRRITNGIRALKVVSFLYKWYQSLVVVFGVF